MFRYKRILTLTLQISMESLTARRLGVSSLDTWFTARRDSRLDASEEMSFNRSIGSKRIELRNA